MEKEQYLAKVFDYLNERNYVLIKEKTYAYHAKAVPKGHSEYFYENGYLKDYDHKKLQSLENLLEFAKWKKEPIESLKNDNVLVDCFISVFNESDKEEKLFLLKNIGFCTSSEWMEKFNYLFGKIIETPKDVNYLNLIPISIWEFYKVPLEELDKLLVEKNIKDKDYDSFYLKFFKARKNQINTPSCGPRAKKFLLDKYGDNDEKLKPYAQFFNYIKELYEDVTLEIYEPTTSSTVISRINCRKASKLLCIPGYDERKIREVIKSFTYLMKDHKGIKQVCSEEIGAGVLEVRCHTDNELTQKELNKEITDFLLFKKNNVDMSVDKKSIDIYYLDKSLRNELSNEKTVNKKMKL